MNIKKLLLSLMLSAYSLASYSQVDCPYPDQAPKCDKWEFLYKQCMDSALVLKYSDTSQVAYVNSKGELVTITYKTLLDSLNATNPATTYPGIWTPRTAIDTLDWRSVAYGNGIFVALAFDGSGNRVQISSDGIHWRPVNSSVANSNPWRAITYGNGVFVAVCGAVSHRVMTSTDGQHWTAHLSAVQNDWRDVAFGNGMFVAVSFNGASSNRIMASYNGKDWFSTPVSSSLNPRSVCFGNGMWVIGSNTDMLSSEDGINWTTRTAAQTNFWQRITYGNGRFVAVSFDGANRVQTSEDGVSWVARNAAENNDWEGVTYGNGYFVAVASTGTHRIMISTNGIDWVSHDAGAQNAWRWVAYGNGTFVSVGNSGAQRVQTSLNSTFNVKGISNYSGQNQYNGTYKYNDTVHLNETVFDYTPNASMTDDIIGKSSTGLGVVIQFEQGKYLPADSAQVNLDALAFDTATYERMGNRVTVWGTFTSDATATNTTSFYITVPIATNMVSPYVSGGGAALLNTTPLIDFGTTQKARVRYVSGSALPGQKMSYEFTYWIQ
jgi:hypothetical protein